jgi:hypothetical protein
VLVAIESFAPGGGERPVRAGVTMVDETSVLARLYPGRFRKARDERSRARRSTSCLRANYGAGAARLASSSTAAKRSPAPVRSPTPPAWQLESPPPKPRRVDIREATSSGYSVWIAESVLRDIEADIPGYHRDRRTGVRSGALRCAFRHEHDHDQPRWDDGGAYAAILRFIQR